jgi:OOP family OmpA-OmpF porin
MHNEIMGKKMNKLRGLVYSALCAVILAACSGVGEHNEIEALNEVQAVGSPFTQHLTSEYRDFANREHDQMFDYPDALHFARKGLASASGETVLPEPVSDWNLTPEHMQELGTARGRLLVAFDLGAREIAPKQSAVAQAKFDCWIEQQEENWQAEDILECKSAYLEAISVLEGMISPAPVTTKPKALPPVEPAPIPEMAEPMKPEEAMYLVFFDFDSSKVSAAGQNVLDAVAEEINGRDMLNVVSIIGHTDSSGTKTYNNRLAMKRANAVRDALISRGVDGSVLRVESRGEDDLLVATPDGVREPANRRAQITFQ